MNLVKSTLPPIEYAELVKETGAKKRRFSYILVVGQLEKLGENSSNEKIAKYVGHEQQTTGRVCKELETEGLIENLSNHAGRRNWRLTQTGWRVFNIVVKDNEEFIKTIG